MPNSVEFTGFHPDTPQDDIFEFIAKYGLLVEATIPRDEETLKPKGMIYVNYIDQATVIKALKDNNKLTVLGQTIGIRRYRKRKRKSESEN